MNIQEQIEKHNESIELLEGIQVLTERYKGHMDAANGVWKASSRFSKKKKEAEYRASISEAGIQRLTIRYNESMEDFKSKLKED